ncbi:MAG: PIG-L family deacetylase [Mesonia hippocampi]|uniref:PIG-L family deacetylase n=1 Tax=Mesonia hippocampi TaxID=1628250 RepID=UPI003F9DB747
MKKNSILLLFSLCFCFILQAQNTTSLTSTEIYQKLKKLNFLGSVLYIAAHPDDENTKLISYYANYKHAQTAYLSLTRGDGGQNLIGPELRELLGVIRTEELMAARAIDGGQQYFSRANDFGYSKHPKETFNIWEENKVFEDVVKTIRQFKPDVIINRFDHRKEGITHGHHTASAQLSVKGFSAAADKNIFPEQVEEYDTWQSQRLFFNTSWWFYGSQEKFDAANKSDMLAVDAGIYSAILGKSNTEIASLSRSQHKSQGFGNSPNRGESLEYLEIIKGEKPNNNDIFEGINTSWTRVKGGDKIGELITQVIEKFDFTQPEKSIPELIKIRRLIAKVENAHWRTIKQKEIDVIILACAGIFAESTTTIPYANPNQEISIQHKIISRNNIPVTLKSITINQNKIIKNTAHQKLAHNQPKVYTERFKVPASINYTSPYWLTEENTTGMYRVSNKKLIGKPRTPTPLTSTFSIGILDETIQLNKAIEYKYTSPVEGEIYQPLAIVPKASVEILSNFLLFENKTPKTLTVKVKAYADSIKGKLKLNLPASWIVNPPELPVELTKNGEEKTFSFSIKPTDNSTEAPLIAELITKESKYTKKLYKLPYKHIPNQIISIPNQAKVINLPLVKKGTNIGYIMGAGDLIPESLTQIGYHVDILSSENLSSENLKKYQAIILGIRAYNTQKALKYTQETLFDYVENGGNLIVQYNTNKDLITEQLAPFRLELSRDRVTDENAKVKFLALKHPVLNSPNKITPQDFSGWVQERGLYFPKHWDKKAFTPILSMSDAGESAKKGSLLIAPYGKGNYIYTGLSFFRELPAGVSGAYRLFVNLISLPKHE